MIKSFLSCKNTKWCIDPCDDCPNMEKVEFDEKGMPIENTLCIHEQGSEECRVIVCPVCESYEPTAYNNTCNCKGCSFIREWDKEHNI